MQKKSSDIINLGEWNTPKKWDDITLKTFQNLERYLDERGEKNLSLIRVLHILCDKKEDEVNALPLDIAEKIMNEMLFLYDDPQFAEATNKIVINDKVFQINILEKLKTGEFVAADTVIRSDKYNYAAILAILCREPDEIYDSHFEAEKFADRLKMFEQCPITKVMPVINFFLQRWLTSETVSLMYSKVEEAINHTRRLIETSQEIGHFKKRYLNYRVTKLEKSLKQSNNI